MEQFIATTIAVTTPIALAALGGVFSWRAGIFHLGLEGLMALGAFFSVAGTIWTGQVVIGVLLGIAASLVASFLFWVIIVPLRANAVIAGLGLTTLGVGGSVYLLDVLFGSSGAIYVDSGLWRPVTGVQTGPLAAVSDVSVLVWAIVLITLLVWWMLRRTHFGLRLSAVGEFPFAARSAGTSPARMRLVALLATGVLCSLAGTELSLGSLNAFTQDITSGRGFIAFTAVIFGGGNPIGAALASLFFGFAEALGIQTSLASQGLPVPREFILMLPYLFTIFAVWLSSVLRRSSSQVGGAFGELREG
jgi:ABC-type uncharacterized transport system permease subunit